VESLILVPGKHEQLRATSAGRWKPVWKRRFAPTLLILGDFLLALLIWRASSILRDIWGHGPLWEMTAVTMVAVITTWVGLRALLGLYPGYGLDAAEQLRRQAAAEVRQRRRG
jgi:di/tricarboxylate transporter